MTRRMRRRAGVLLAVALLALAGAALASLELPYRGFAGETFVRFDRGSGTVAMARALEQAGVVRYAWQFWLARALNSRVKLSAGEYRFSEPANVFDIFGRIARGDVYYLEVSIPEGSNMFDIARLAEAAGVMSAQDFLNAAEDPGSIRDLDPNAPTLEGYLFPATYRLSHSTTAAAFCAMMTGQFRHYWKMLRAGQPADPHRVVTLASMVEKETALPEERPLVAGVFANRLKLGMKLDCDPTTIYAALLDNRYRGVIHRSDLNSHNPYNTYQSPGLPPGPIANPGAEALAAALHPAETEYLYFVAKPSGGGHQFSKTLAAHDKAVRDYRHGPSQTPKRAAKSPKKA
jgi:peptidoglycan lytic transglycosylase G